MSFLAQSCVEDNSKNHKRLNLISTSGDHTVHHHGQRQQVNHSLEQADRF